MKLDILAFGAHPDDIELGCGATIAKATFNGKKVGVVDLTEGELGTNGSVKTRYEEAAVASKILGLSVRENLKFADGFFENNKAHQLEVIKMIRKYKPEIVLCNAIHDRHIDHGRGSKLVSDSCFLSGLSKIETTLDNKPQEKWRPKQVYHYIQWLNIEPDFVVDVSGFIDAKMDSIFAYKTQFYYPGRGENEPKTPITSKNFTDSLKYRAVDLGRIIGKDHAEGFTVERHAAVDSLFDLK